MTPLEYMLQLVRNHQHAELQAFCEKLLEMQWDVFDIYSAVDYRDCADQLLSTAVAAGPDDGDYILQFYAGHPTKEAKEKALLGALEQKKYHQFAALYHAGVRINKDIQLTAHQQAEFNAHVFWLDAVKTAQSRPSFTQGLRGTFTKETVNLLNCAIVAMRILCARCVSGVC